MRQKSEEKFSLIGLLIWGINALFYVYEFFLQIFLGTVANDIMRDLNLDASQFALLGAGFFAAYGLMQIPVGILVDRFGVRKVVPIAALIIASGNFIFSAAHSLPLALIGRILMGIGCSFGYVSLLVTGLNWFPKRYFGLVTGMSLFLGALGPVLAGAPLAYLLKALNNNWRIVINGLGFIGLFLSLIVALFMRNKPAKSPAAIVHLDPNPQPIRQKLKAIFANKQAWVILFFASFLYAALPTVGANWGTAYLQTRGLDRGIAALITSMIWIGFAVGSPIVGLISQHSKRRVSPMIATAFIGVLCSLMILYLPIQLPFFLGVLFFTLGGAGAGMSISYAAVTENVAPELRPASLGFNNTAVCLFSAFLPALSGKIIEIAAVKYPATGSAPYSLGAYKLGLSVMPVVFILSLIIAFFLIRETFCRNQTEALILRPDKTP